MKTTKVPGIYRITKSTNGKFYIGSAKNLANRFASHRKDLRKNHFIDIRVKTGLPWRSIAKQLKIEYRQLRKEYEKIKNEM